MDNCYRECLTLVTNALISGLRVARELAQLRCKLAERMNEEGETARLTGRRRVTLPACSYTIKQQLNAQAALMTKHIN